MVNEALAERSTPLRNFNGDIVGHTNNAELAAYIGLGRVKWRNCVSATV